MICTHTFIKIGEITKPRPGVTSMHGGIMGADAGCVRCGQVRRIWADGQVEIMVKGGKPIEEDTLQENNRVKVPGILPIDPGFLLPSTPLS